MLSEKEILAFKEHLMDRQTRTKDETKFLEEKQSRSCIFLSFLKVTNSWD
jgi:hypothetical protein